MLQDQPPDAQRSVWPDHKGEAEQTQISTMGLAEQTSNGELWSMCLWGRGAPPLLLPEEMWALGGWIS